MGYFDLAEAIYKSDVNNDPWTAFAWLYDGASTRDTSYKFLFFEALLSCDLEKEILSYEEIFFKFTSFAWDLVLKYKIRQKKLAKDGRLTELENILSDYATDNFMGGYIDWDELSAIEQKKIVKKILSRCKKYVVGAFYGDTKEVLYSFSRKDEWIILNPHMKAFIVQNQDLLRNLNHNKWAYFYASRDDPVNRDRLETIISEDNFRQGENVYRFLISEVVQKYLKSAGNINSFEILLDAKDHATKNISIDLDSYESEEELFSDFDQMKKYLDDPELIIRKLQENKQNGSLK